MFPPESGCPRTVGCVRFEATIDVAAPAQFLFEVYTDVERWPEWTASVTSVERLDQGMARVRGLSLQAVMLSPRQRVGARSKSPHHWNRPLLGPLLGFLTKQLTNRYLQIELRGLKAHCEG